MTMIPEACAMNAMPGMMPGMGLGMMITWGLLVLGILALAGLGIIWLAGRLGRTGQASAETPEEILRRRYAAGEVDEDEYLRRLSGLTQP